LEAETEPETEQISEADASGAEAPIDHRKRLFNEGLKKLAAMTGKGPDACRSFVGKCLKAASDDAIVVLGLIEDAERNQTVDPTAWIAARLKPRENSNGRRTVHDAARDLHSKQSRPSRTTSQRQAAYATQRAESCSAATVAVMRTIRTGMYVPRSPRCSRCTTELIREVTDPRHRDSDHRKIHDVHAERRRAQGLLRGRCGPWDRMQKLGAAAAARLQPRAIAATTAFARRQGERVRASRQPGICEAARMVEDGRPAAVQVRAAAGDLGFARHMGKPQDAWFERGSEIAQRTMAQIDADGPCNSATLARRMMAAIDAERDRQRDCGERPSNKALAAQTAFPDTRRGRWQGAQSKSDRG
jgi:hypothetical protein